MPCPWHVAESTKPPSVISAQRNRAMPKASRKKYYAVRVGRGGPKIYNAWEECQDKVTKFPGAIHKSFSSREQAEQWLAEYVPKSSLSASTSTDIVEDPAVNTTSPSHREPEHASDASAATPNVVLSREQRAVLDKVKKGRNVFFTGPAGTGKSVLLREIIRVLGGGHSETLAITASTGIAAVNIGGVTVHSWAGIGLGHEPTKNLVGKLFGQSKFANVLNRWQRVKTLIIDEISMIDGVLFDKLEDMARQLRHNDSPFGGIQLVLCGDFCQLPPVPGRDTRGNEIPARFAFEADKWIACVGKPITLSRVFRQRDQVFAKMLNAIRFGRIDEEIVATFHGLSRKVAHEDGIEPTQLFSTRDEVDRANSTRLRELRGGGQKYRSHDFAGVDSTGQKVSPIRMERLLERLVAPKFIELKVGAQVMLIKNIVQGELVNGSVGQVVGFRTPAEAQRDKLKIAQPDGAEKHSSPPLDDVAWPVVRFIGGKELLCVPYRFTINNAEGSMEACREQLPLILAWAISIHKSQGQTLERVKVDLRRTFEKGQVYVALSRATSMDGLQVLNFKPEKVMVHPRVLVWHNESPSGHRQSENEHMDDDEAAYWDF